MFMIRKHDFLLVNMSVLEGVSFYLTLHFKYHFGDYHEIVFYRGIENEQMHLLLQ